MHARSSPTTPASRAFDIFGGIDALKLHSSMTLFAHAAPDDPLFKTVLDRYFDAQADPQHPKPHIKGQTL